MVRLLLHILIESLLASAFFLAGVWLIGMEGTLALTFGIIAVVIGFLLLTHIILAAAFGKVRTPFDLGAGHRVPGTPDPEMLRGRG